MRKIQNAIKFLTSKSERKLMRMQNNYSLVNSKVEDLGILLKDMKSLSNFEIAQINQDSSAIDSDDF